MQIQMMDQMMDAWEEQIRSPDPMTVTSRMLSKLKSLPSVSAASTWPSCESKRPECHLSLAVVYMPGAQLLGLCLLGVLEIVVGLHEKKPRTLPIADRTCLL